MVFDCVAGYDDSSVWFSLCRTLADLLGRSVLVVVIVCISCVWFLRVGSF